MRKVRLEYVHVRICGPRDNKRDWSEHLVALPVFFQSRLVPQGCKGHVGTIAKKIDHFHRAEPLTFAGSLEPVC